MKNPLRLAVVLLVVPPDTSRAYHTDRRHRLTPVRPTAILRDPGENAGKCSLEKTIRVEGGDESTLSGLPPAAPGMTEEGA